MKTGNIFRSGHDLEGQGKLKEKNNDALHGRSLVVTALGIVALVVVTLGLGERTATKLRGGF